MEPGSIVCLKSGGLPMTVRFTVDDRASLATGREIGVVCDWIDTAGMPQEMTFQPEQLKIHEIR